MPSWIRRSLIALAAVLLVLVAGVVVLVASFDANRYKGLAIDWMKANRNRTLAIDGPIELSVFPRLALRASRVSLSEAGRAERFASVEQAALSVALLPLLRGSLQVDRVEASGVQLVLRRDAQGRLQGHRGPGLRRLAGAGRHLRARRRRQRLCRQGPVRRPHHRQAAAQRRHRAGREHHRR